ncbi:hypothetical protein [Psychrobacter sanguinis]|uniref:hypothetical protein n=1 Tax=Psychrobacter sanguinis TaxID=861445 RepID=UPI002A75249D|nr:hypothetical protein [Psychrobacter sanguinis]MDY3306416.1 hypothetical protein [Psychrobacter sanguinis]
MGNPYGDDPQEYLDDDEELTVMQRQRQHDLRIALAQQGLTESDFPDGVPPGVFINESDYD